MYMRVTIPILLFVILSAGWGFPEQGPGSSVRRHTGGSLNKGPDTDAAQFPSLEAAIASARTSQSATLLISRKTVISGTVTVPATIGVRMLSGGILSVPAGSRLAIEGALDSDLRQIFAGEGQVTIGSLVKQVYPQWWGARGDGSIDDTAAMGKAAASLSHAGGTLFLPAGTYRMTAQLKLPGNVRLTGQGATILGDFTGYSLIHAEGIYGKGKAVTGDIKAGATTIRVADASGIAPGDLIQLQDDRNATRYAREILFVKNVGAGTITVTAPVTMPYKVAYHASLSKISGLENIEIDNVTFEGSTKSSLNYMIFIRNGHHVKVHDCLIKGHRFPAKPNLLISLYVSQSYDVAVDSVSTQGLADIRLDAGNCIALFACGKGSVTNCKLHKCAFGIGAWMGTDYLIANNQVEGFHQSGRGIKLAGSYNSRIVNNTVKATDSGIKHEDSGRNIIQGNEIISCGVASYSSGINLSNQQKSAEGDDYAGVTVEGNTVRNQTGNGIYADDQSHTAIIANNIIDHVTDRGIVAIGDSIRITGNRVTETAGTGIVFNPRGATVSGNYVRSANREVKSFRVASVNLPETCQFTDNSAPDNPWDTAVSPKLLGVYRSNNIPGMPSGR